MHMQQKALGSRCAKGSSTAKPGGVKSLQDLKTVLRDASPQGRIRHVWEIF